jgi:membrane-bound ClpP family serine protease
MIGKLGEADSDLDPWGIVKVENEIWKARVEGGDLRAGDAVEIMDVDGLTLKVRPLEGSR